MHHFHLHIISFILLVPQTLGLISIRTLNNVVGYQRSCMPRIYMQYEDNMLARGFASASVIACLVFPSGANAGDMDNVGPNHLEVYFKYCIFCKNRMIRLIDLIVGPSVGKQTRLLTNPSALQF